MGIPLRELSNRLRGRLGSKMLMRAIRKRRKSKLIAMKKRKMEVEGFGSKESMLESLPLFSRKNMSRVSVG